MPNETGRGVHERLRILQRLPGGRELDFRQGVAVHGVIRASAGNVFDVIDSRGANLRTQPRST